MSDRGSVIAVEQKAVDLAYDCLERRYAENRAKLGRRDDRTDAKGPEFLRDAAPEIRYHPELDGRPLVVRRVDVLEGGAERTWYIGAQAVRDEEYELVVIDWRAEQARQWMLAEQDAPGDVLLRRLLRCDGRRVLDYFDEVSVQAVLGRAVVEDEESFARLRDFLLEDLERARDGRMRDIVATIQREQMAVVTDRRDGVLVVQGGPGTGKSAVGLHRASWLIYNEVFGTDEVLVVGPHRGFLEHVRDVLPQLGTREVRLVELDRLWDGARGSDPLPARAVKSDRRMADVLRRAVENLRDPAALTRQARSGEFRLQLDGRSVALSWAEIEARLSESDRAESYQAGRLRFGYGLVDRLVQEYRREYGSGDVRARVQEHALVARLINSVRPTVTAENLLRGLLTDPARLRAAADGILGEAEQEAILRPRAARLAEEPWSTEDLVCLEELRVLLTGEKPPDYRHIVIDEAQDLTPMQARSLARRCPERSLTVLGDLAQSAGPHRYTDWGELAEILAGPVGWMLEELAVGYRVPQEVMEFAEPLGRVLSPATDFPRSIRPAGAEAVTLLVTDSGALLEKTASRASELAADDDQGRSVAVIVPDVLLAEAEGMVLPPAAQLLRAAQAKGLEFDHVIVVEPAAVAGQGPAGPGLLYVALTRCTQSLTVVHSEPLPQPLVPAAGFRAFLSYVEEAVRAERRCEVHEEVRRLLAEELARAGHSPVGTSPVADLVCDGPGGRVLYEVLGEGPHTYRDLREAAVRLMEVQHAECRRADRRVVVLPCAPAEDWAAAQVEEAFDVSVLWRTRDGWGGDLSVFG